MKILSGSGHRPDKLPNKQTGYRLPNPTYNYVCQETEKILLAESPDKVITGGALGYDSYLAFVCCKLQIPFEVFVPFEGQEKAWPQSSQETYHKILTKAAAVKIICKGGYSADKMQLRNEAMVNAADKLLACFDGSPGGTKNCIQYALKMNKEIIYIDPTKATNA